MRFACFSISEEPVKETVKEIARPVSWIKWERDLMTILALSQTQAPTPTNQSARDMTTDKENWIGPLDQLNPTNSSLGPKPPTIYYYPWNSGIGYDSTFMKVGINGVWGSSGIPRRN